MTPKEIRTEVLKMTQGQLAAKLGITKAALANKENGKRKFTAKEIILLGSIAGVSPSKIEL